MLRSLLPLFLCLGLSLGLAQDLKQRGTSVGEPPQDHSPAAEAASFKLLEGFKVNLVASEDTGVPNPLQLRWDERGRLWVLSCVSYPQPSPDFTPDDKVIILEDADHDGSWEKRTVYAEGLRMPMGIELAGKGELYVGEGEKLLLLKDTDGDDKADVREVVFSGFGTGDTHQNINSFVWAPDGALVMHQGLHCYSRVTTAHGVRQLYGAGFWHFWPGVRRLDPFPTGMPLNAWGTVHDKEGQPMMIAGAAGMYWARPMEFSVPETPGGGEHGQPYFLLSRFALPYGGQIIKTEGLRKFCGLDLVGNSHWPVEMQGELISGGFFDNAIFRHKLTTDAASPSGYEATEQKPLITSSNVAFRPVDVRFGPDGALYVADWYDPIIGHYQASFRHPNRDAVRGRIWRVAHTGRPLVQQPAVGDRWADYQALRLRLAARAAGVPERADLQLRLESKDAVLRAAATHELGAWVNGLPASEVTNWLAARVKDESARVRLEAVVACGKWAHADAVLTALRVLDLPMDTFLDRALWLCVHATSPHWKPALLAGQVPAVPAAHLAFLMERDGSAEVLGGARDLLGSKAETLAPELRCALATALARKGKPADAALVLRVGLADAAVLQVLTESASQRHYAAPAGAEALVQQLLSSKDEAQQVAAVRLIGAWKMKSLWDTAQQWTMKADAAEALRVAALEALAPMPKKVAELQEMLKAAATSAALRLAALKALVSTDATQAGQTWAAALVHVKDAEGMKLWLAPLLSREPAVAAAAAALKEKPCSAETARLCLQALSGMGRSDAALTTELGKLAGVKMVVPAYSGEWVADMAREVKAAGDAVKGKAVFHSTLVNCTACHAIEKKGGIIGPELDTVGRGVPVELLIEAVVWPQRQIKEGYVATTLTLKDGRKLMGYKVSDANGELQLRDVGAGMVHRLPMESITERNEAGSLMPDGLAGMLSQEELRDLVAYLVSLGR